MKSLYVGSKACVRVGNEVRVVSSESGAETGMCDVAVVFSLYIDGVVREIYARVLGRGLKLVDGNDSE